MIEDERENGRFWLILLGKRGFFYWGLLSSTEERCTIMVSQGLFVTTMLIMCLWEILIKE
ncbi:hypothetical protein BVD23_20040 [Salmonella enterica]|nr:hypothetical protein [Salmonella enterica]EAN4947546.1 hypothetical protein [Salmonella enterica]EBI7619894.1 hypothetical protein [Salmonella enterica]EBI8101795.1 hypothetical protein [Salmonella enterica]EBK3007651.1 hypothetical protein [Salmonella enterica]